VEIYLGLLLRFLVKELPFAVPFVIVPMFFSKAKRGINIKPAEIFFVCSTLLVVILALPNFEVSLHYLGYLLAYLLVKIVTIDLNHWSLRMFVLSVLFYSLSMLINSSVYLERSINYLLLTKLHLFALVLLSTYSKEKLSVRFIFALVILASLFMTHARTNAFLGLFVVVFGFFRWINRRYSFRMVFLAGLILASVIAVISPYIADLKVIERIYTDSLSGAMRYKLWHQAIENMNMGSLITGHGAGASMRLSNLFGMPYIHNIFLEWVYDFGVIGLALCIFFTATILKALIDIFKGKSPWRVLIATIFLLEMIQFLKSFDGLQIWSLVIITSVLWKE